MIFQSLHTVSRSRTFHPTERLWNTQHVDMTGDTNLPQLPAALSDEPASNILTCSHLTAFQSSVPIPCVFARMRRRALRRPVIRRG